MKSEGLPGPVAGPATPQQEQEQRIHTDGAPIRSLTEQFEEFSTLEGREDASAAAALADRLHLRASSEVLSSSSGDCELQAWSQAEHDSNEPILQPNDERFCLLPVK
jgi:hypothetical protein